MEDVTPVPGTCSTIDLQNSRLKRRRGQLVFCAGASRTATGEGQGALILSQPATEAHAVLPHAPRGLS